MFAKRSLAACALAGTLSLGVPAPTQADGAASTRNLILLGGAATYLIIQHNRHVHEQRAAAAQAAATQEQGASDAWSAYAHEQRAYDEEVAINRELQQEIAYQHSVVVRLQQQLAALNVRSDFTGQQAANDYGWGQL